MKLTKGIGLFFALLAAVLILGTVGLCLRSLDAPVKLLASAQDAEARTETLMEALVQGDYDGVSSVLYGQPSLGGDEEPSQEIGVLLWEAYGSSISYTFDQGCYATDTGLARDVTVTALDISAVMAPLEERFNDLLEEQAAEEDPSVVYDEDDGYREEFVMAVLAQAAEQVLTQGSYLSSQTVTLELTCQDGQWWVVPGTELLRLLSGGLA